MKIAIWGGYDHGNFGDDLMALHFAHAVREAGATPVVYRLDARLAARYEVTSVHDLDELLSGAALCIVGGGWMLFAHSYLRWAARSVARAFERDCDELREACERHGVRIHPISIGGDGTQDPRKLSRWRRRLFRSPRMGSATVRLQDDVTLLHGLGVDAVHHPDVVLSAAVRWLPGPDEGRTRPSSPHVGVNLIRRTGRPLARRLVALAAERPDLSFHFIRSHLPGYPHRYEVLPESDLPNVHHYVYEDPRETIAFLAGLSLLISSKLHLGVTAMSAGVPFWSYGPSGKTRRFLESVGAKGATWERDQDEALVGALARAAAGGTFDEVVDRRKFADLQDRSRGHTERAHELVGGAA